MLDMLYISAEYVFQNLIVPTQDIRVSVLDLQPICAAYGIET